MELTSYYQHLWVHIVVDHNVIYRSQFQQKKCLSPKVDTPLFAATDNPLQLCILPGQKSLPLNGCNDRFHERSGI